MAKKVLIIFLVLASAFVRFYRFADFTEFLGDQGRDGVIVAELLERKKIPETGSPLSTGQNTGPFHFYLIAPLFIFSAFNPIVPAIGLCTLEIAGVILMLLLAISLFGFSIGYSVSLLYSLSPLLVHQDRILWPPTPIPFFVLLVTVSMYVLATKRKYWALVPLFLANTVLIQIHYANGITMAASGAFYIWMLQRSIREKKGRRFILWTIVAACMSIAVSWPFLAYEIRHGFSDVVSAFGTFLSAKGLPFSKRLYVQNVATLLSQLTGYVFPFHWKALLVLLAAMICLLGILGKNRWTYFFAGWLLTGISVLALYRDTLQPQYSYGLIPVIFLVTGGALVYLSKHILLKFVLIGCAGLAIFMISQLDIFSTGSNDIARVKALTDTIIQKSGGQPFSFTLISTRSYSDFHYRFYFKLKHISPVAIDSSEYTRLFLVCESGQCPSVEEIHMNQKVYAMCYDILCKLNYPIVDIWKWRYDNKIAVGSSVVYEYRR